jgi:NADH-quinone oxidoreductase subunit F
MQINKQDIESIVGQTGNRKSDLIAVLQQVQEKYKYLPKEALEMLPEYIESTPADISGVVSFYAQFRTEPVGKNMIKVCDGTACHVKGSELVYKAFRRHFDLPEGSHTDAENKYTIEKVGCVGCCTLAPVVQINNTTYGHITPDQVERVIQDFETQKDKSKTLFKDSSGKEIEGEIRIGLGSCCVAGGSMDIKDEIEQTVAQNAINVNIKSVGCVGMCHQIPLVEVLPENGKAKLYAKVQPDDIQDILNRHFRSGNFFRRLQNRLFGTLEAAQNDHSWEGVHRFELNVREKQVESFLGKQIPIATENRGVLNPLDLEEYIRLGGFEGFKKALKLQPSEIIETVKKSGMRGRGGAGFPTYKKWEIVRNHSSKEKYLICNGDEGDPGAFMDRMILESYPYRVIEGMLIAAYAAGASKAYFYIRAEYPLAISRIKSAIDECRKVGRLGENIPGSGFSLDAEVVQGAGAFVCGEETAMINAIQGGRGNPVFRPPYPAEKGLFGKPTLINNTETLAQISFILDKGAERFSAIGTKDSPGTKVFALAGKIKNGGLIEVPLGISIREIVEDIGGGIAGGKQFKAVQTGGPSGGCIPERLADTPVDFESLSEIDSMMGSGGLVVLDEDDCMVEMARYFLSFTQEESCGKCTFCRVGTKRMLDILDRLCTGKARKNDIDELEQLCEQVPKGSLCGLGKTAPNPVITTLKYFREEYEAHAQGYCPSGKCSAIITYSVNDNCIGCTICAQKCPVDAIAFTPYEKHFIDTELCIECDNCYQVCPEDAITVE